MTLKLRNDWKYKGNDWWEWGAFLDDGGSGELSNVECVEYVLHETFPEPVCRIDKPDGGFRLDTGGWGTFMLKVFVYSKDGKKIKLEHNIQLQHDPPNGQSE